MKEMEESQRLNQINILAHEAEHKTFVFFRCKDLIEMFENSYDAFLMSINESRYQYDRENDKEYHKVFVSMCMKINCDVRMIYSAILLGWYGTAQSLIREINDGIVKIIFITLFPAESSKISDGMLNNREIRALLKKNNIKTPLSGKAWGEISRMKHAEGKEVWIYGESIENETRTKFFPIITTLKIEGLFTYTSGLLINVAENYHNFHISHYGDSFTTPGYSKLVQKMASLLANILKNENRNFEETNN